MTTTSRLATELQATNALPAEWREPFLAVHRHRFLPDQFWIDDEQNRPVPVSRDEDPQRWRDWAYRDVPILTQFDDGRTVWPDSRGEVCTSSASKPALVLRMLDALDVRDGQRVLEIGTGTGYNAALLAARLGAGRVFTVEIDSVSRSRRAGGWLPLGTRRPW